MPHLENRNFSICQLPLIAASIARSSITVYKPQKVVLLDAIMAAGDESSADTKAPAAEHMASACESKPDSSASAVTPAESKKSNDRNGNGKRNKEMGRAERK